MRRAAFETIRSEGGLLPVDLLERLAARQLEGVAPADYNLIEGERLNEAIDRAWTRLRNAWSAFREAAGRLPDAAPDAGMTRDRWLLVLFHELGFGRLDATRAHVIDGRDYPISHLRPHVPIHLVGFRTDLDTRTPGVAGAARQSPHSLVQELLNRSSEHLWGFVSNGLRLRVLRDSAALTRQAYLELDLEAMFDGAAFADFAILWLVCHQSRVEGTAPEQCWLERWLRAAQEQGTRALDRLRDGVTAAIEALGGGFLAHARNGRLRERLRTGGLDAQDYYRQLLRLVYRLLFLFVAEDRDLLLAPDAPATARERYRRHYSTQRLRRLAERHRGTAHADLWDGLRVVMRRLDETGSAELGLPALGSFLWRQDAVADLDAAELANRDLLAAVRALAFSLDGNVLRGVDYKNLAAEELGSVYESLLELHPRINAAAPSFELATAGGHERRTTGSYYTPESLVQCLLDSALEPVIEERLAEAGLQAASGGGAEALLRLRIVDPACGSGHFLIAAAHRMARHLARVRTGDTEPAPEAMRGALRDVIAHCIYGVDVNEMAVELCKVSLWLESLEPGRPLSFLDHRIQCGNSLLGTTPALLAAGIPDAAFQPIEGDERDVVASLRRQNRQEREGARRLFAGNVAEAAAIYGGLTERVAGIDQLDDDSVQAVLAKEVRYQRFTESAEYRHARLVADAWCAAFVMRKAKGAAEPITQDVFLRLREDAATLPAVTRAEVERLSRQYRFLHWHLAFPDVFVPPASADAAERPDAGWSGGFDVVLGNPPWERIKLQEREWFAARAPEIAAAPNAAARRRHIAALAEDDPALFEAWTDALRIAEGESHLVRHSDRYPLCGRGDVNTYSIFAETNRLILRDIGRVGCIVPSGVATDDTTKLFFNRIMDAAALVSLFSFREIRRIFIDTDSRNPFCLLTLTGERNPSLAGADFVFSAEDPSDLHDDWRHFTLTADDIALLNPNTRTCPVFRSRRDAEITKAIYRRVPVLVREGPPEENPWGAKFATMFHMANDSGLFRTREQLESEGWNLQGNVFHRGDARYLPLYEAKMVHHFNHRYGDYRDRPPDSESTSLPDVPLERLQDPDYVVLPRYWVPVAEVDTRLPGRWPHAWLLGWRDICRNTDERTVIASLFPAVGVGHKLPIFMTSNGGPGAVASMYGNLTAFVFDYVARQKIGSTSLTYFYLKQLPALSPGALQERGAWSLDVTYHDWIARRVVELTYSASDLDSFGDDLGFGRSPYPWSDTRRPLLRAELDAVFFHLYGIARDDVDYIMETFPIVKRDDLQRHGEYRTKHLILEVYDRMQRAIDSGEPYQTLLDPPPADPRLAHGAAPTSVPAVEHLRAQIAAIRGGGKSGKGYELELPYFDELRPAAGALDGSRAAGGARLVRVRASRRYESGRGRGYYVVQVHGASMEPEIPNGAFGIVRRPASAATGTRVLVQRHADEDPERGGRYAVKTLRRAPDGQSAQLVSLNPAYAPIEVTDQDRILADWVERVELVEEGAPDDDGG